MKRILMWVLPVALACAACGKKDEGGDKPADKPAVKPMDKPADPPAEDKTALIERGKYVATLSACALCHTPMGPQGQDQTKLFAGGLEVKESFGTWRSLNITPDDETGIGKWSDEEIIAAIRTGMRPDGKGLSVFMPFMFYNAMSDDDATALVAYLRSVPAVSNKVERSELPLPTADKMPVPKPSGKAPPEGDEVARGQYVATLAHCATCHTPFDEKTGMPDMKRMYAGGMKIELYPPFGEGVIYTPNLTPHETGLAAYSEEDIVKAVRTMQKKDGKTISPPMMLYAPFYGAINDADAMALAKFIKSLPPIENKIPASKYKITMPMGPPPGDKPPAEGDGPGKGT